MWNKLSDEQKHFIEAYNHLVQNNETITSMQYAKRIENCYDMTNQRNKIAAETIANMSFEISRSHKGIGLKENKVFGIYSKKGEYFKAGDTSECRTKMNRNGYCFIGHANTDKEIGIIIEKEKKRTIIR